MMIMRQKESQRKDSPKTGDNTVHTFENGGNRIMSVVDHLDDIIDGEINIDQEFHRLSISGGGLCTKRTIVEGLGHFSSTK